jgi:hypothetical protein
MLRRFSLRKPMKNEEGFLTSFEMTGKKGGGLPRAIPQKRPG